MHGSTICIRFDIADLRHPQSEDALEANCDIYEPWLAHPYSMDALQASEIWSQNVYFLGGCP